jgi:hypothetical protein
MSADADVYFSISHAFVFGSSLLFEGAAAERQLLMRARSDYKQLERLPSTGAA